MLLEVQLNMLKKNEVNKEKLSMFNRVRME